MSKYGDWAHLFLRLAVAAVFIYHGTQKWPMLSAPMDDVTFMAVIMKVLAVVEPVAAVGLILGLWTRLWALVLMVVMLGAIYMKTLGSMAGDAPSFARWEMDMLLFVMNLVLFIEGPGKYSADAKMRG